MKNDLLPLSVSLSGKPFGIGSEGKNGKSDGEIPTKKLLRDFVFAPEVVNYNRNLGVEYGFQSRGVEGQRSADGLPDSEP